jgi:hypothetical protein
MFDGTRFASAKLQKILPEWSRNLLWYLIEEMIVPEKNRIQYFQLGRVFHAGEYKQKIIHIQQQPNYHEEYILTVRNPIDAAIFVIDDVTHCTMLLAEEL